jgi:hypothetical protein
MSSFRSDERRDWGDNVFDGLPVAKGEPSLFSQNLADHDLAAETRPPVQSEKVFVGPQEPDGNRTVAPVHFAPCERLESAGKCPGLVLRKWPLCWRSVRCLTCPCPPRA